MSQRRRLGLCTKGQKGAVGLSFPAAALCAGSATLSATVAAVVQTATAVAFLHVVERIADAIERLEERVVEDLLRVRPDLRPTVNDPVRHSCLARFRANLNYAHCV